VGVKGKALLRLWVPEGVAVTTHSALLPDFAKELQRPGFASMLPKTPNAAAKQQRSQKPSGRPSRSNRAQAAAADAGA
jgi:hypothetical protein